MKTKIVAAYPCLGKTTIANSNRERFFDREFFESRSTKNMSAEDRSRFFDLCADMIELQFLAKTHKVLFISEDDEILLRLIRKKIPFELVLPNVFVDSVMSEYKTRVIKRSGEEWWERVIAPELPYLKDRINFYKSQNLVKVYLINESQYIDDVVDLE